MTYYHLAQINIGRVRAPVDDPIMEGFMARLDAINALAEASPGFVWRLQTDAGNATDIHVYEDERLLLNMSIWENIDALSEFTYKSLHAEPLRMRKDWFEKMDVPFVALWWIPVGQLPTALEGKERLAHLHQHGPTARAFNFKTRFPMPEGEVAR
ncbi:MAG TPA: DUF3291 domain-containing protein [Aggregatilineales bacterium]|nr:DUF3291 domain-containing protein [Aggregatilineales bacterium]